MTAILAQTVPLAAPSARKKAQPEAVLRPWQTVIPTLALTLLSVVTTVGFCRIFEGWSFLPTMLTVVIGTHLAAFLLRLAHTPVWVAIPASLVLIVILVGWKMYPDTMNGPFPSGRTWDLIGTDLSLARTQFPNAVPPVAAIGGFLSGACLVAALAAALSDAFAFRAYGRTEAVTPAAVLFIFASALGMDRNRVHITAIWLATALAVVALLRATHAQSEHTWLGSRGRVTRSVAPVAAVLAVLAATGAALAGPRLPGAHERGLINTRGHNQTTSVVSPMVDVRSKLTNKSNLEMFTIAATEPGYWRLTGLPSFNGNGWDLPDGELEADVGFSRPLAAFHIVEQDIQITSMTGGFVPAAYSALFIDNPDVFGVAQIGALVMPDDGVKPGDRFQITSALVDVSPEILRAVPSNVAINADDLALPGGFPQEARNIAAAVTANGETMYDKALLLQNWFRTNFTYDVAVQSGQSNDAISNFLRVKRGFCQQFSVSFASMARSVGIPARVAIGFTQGDLGTDGRYHVFGRNAHAWPEVYFDQIGWIAFEPTPGRGQAGAQGITGVAPEQAAPTRSTGGATSGIPVPTPSAPRGPIDGNDPRADAAKNDPAAAAKATEGLSAGSSQGASTLALVILGFGGLCALWLVCMPRLVGLYLRRRAALSPKESVLHSWVRTNRALEVIGIDHDLTNTPHEQARVAHLATGIDRHTLDELATRATTAIYGDQADPLAAQRCDSLTNIVLLSVNERMTLRQHIACRINPRMAIATATTRSAQLSI